MTESSLIAKRITLCRTLPLLLTSAGLGFTEPRNDSMAERNEEDARYDIFYPIDGRLLIDPTRITLGKMISEGHYSEVYAGLYKSKAVAVKVINTDDLSSPDWKERFQREVTLLSNMNSDNVVKLVGTSLRPRMIIVTELVRGGNLQKFLCSIRPIRLDLAHAITLAIEISKAMEYLHFNGIIHRNLKPSNILLPKENKIKLADFGLAREEVPEDMTSETGNYRWMAPEIFKVNSQTRDEKLFYDHKVDVYSFSMILWELVVNQTPFSGRHSLLAAYAAASKSDRPSIKDVPEDIANLLKSCWAEDPGSRPEFNEITEVLTKYLHKICPPKKVEQQPELEPEPDQVMKRTERRGGMKLRSFFTRLFGCFRG